MSADMNVLVPGDAVTVSDLTKLIDDDWCLIFLDEDKKEIIDKNVKLRDSCVFGYPKDGRNHKQFLALMTEEELNKFLKSNKDAEGECDLYLRKEKKNTDYHINYRNDVGDVLIEALEKLPKAKIIE